MESEGRKKAERFSSSSTVAGVIVIVAVVAVMAGGVFDSTREIPVWCYPCGVLVAVAVWVVMLRPAVLLGEDELELRNVFHSRWIPYLQITGVVVEQVTSVRTEGGTYLGSGFGRTRRTIQLDRVRAARGSTKDLSLGLLVEQKIKRRIDTAREFADRTGHEPSAPVRRTWAWPEIAALSTAAVVTLVFVLVA